MDDDERAALLRRVNRQSATVGATIPDTITVGGDELDLGAFLIETRKVDTIPPEARETLAEAKEILREERRRRIARLESESLDREAAEAIADEIVGIDRSLNALENIRRPAFGDESGAARIEDHRRWLDFLDTVRR